MLRTARWITGSFLRDAVLFVLVWFWTYQLLIPFGEATAIPDVSIFSLFIGVLFAADLLVGGISARLVLKALVLSAFVYYLYYQQNSIPDLTWVSQWLTDSYNTVVAAFSSDLQLLPESGRTTVFMLTLWMFQAFLRQSLSSRGWMFVVLIVGTVALGVMDSFFVKDAKWNIVLFLFLGLLILAFMQLPAIERIARMPRLLNGWPAEWLVWTLVLSLVVVGTSSAAPKIKEPSWPDPIAFLQAKKGSGTGQQKIGYGNDDTKLGGPFQMDDTVVFTVKTKVEQYYRGEAKVTYTGKGWLSGSIGVEVPDMRDITPLQRMEPPVMEGERVVQEYEFKQNMAPVVINQYRMTGIEQLNTQQENTLLYSDLDSRMSLNELRAGDSYRVVSTIPYFDEQKLKSANVPKPNALFRPYLSLPVTLPKRVRDLAQEITADAKTPYERAKAIESYLHNSFTYETEDVPVPAEDQDFVDQFLFESKRGYCDHFSSAMVVMARAVGLPARWVKGFTKGDVDLSYRSNVEGEYLYVVKNRNAHSWPEIYFEGIGWVAFEPTSTFTMPHLFKPEEETSLPLPSNTDQVEKREKDLEEETSSASATSFEIDWKAIGKGSLWLAGIALVLAILFRRRLLTAYYLRRAYKADDEVAQNALRRLLYVLGKLGYQRREDMTLREYALHLSGDQALRGREMIPLAKIFERVFYGQQRAVTQKERSQIRELWMRIIRKAGRTKR
jgi:transglutaminase-like putative cysteine protease